MGMFGAQRPGGRSFGDVLSILGAGLKDASPGASGNLDAVQQMMAQRQALAQQQAEQTAARQQLEQIYGGAPASPQGGLMASNQMPQATPYPPGVTPQMPSTGGGAFGARPGPDLSDPRVQRALIAAAQAKLPEAGTVLDILKANQPDVQVGPDGTTFNKRDPSALQRRFANRTNVNGSIVDVNNPENEGRFYGNAPVNGAMPVKDAAGNIVDWKMPEGALGSIAASSFATSRGNAKGTAPFDFVNVPGPKGAPRVMSKAVAAGGDFVGTAPDDVAYNTAGAQAGQGRMQGYVGAGQKAGATLTTLGRLRQLDQGIGGGKLTPVGVDVASYANSLGIKLDPKLPNKEAIAALTNKLVLDSSGGSLGTGFSNADRSFMEKMSPSLANTPQGRKLMMDFASAKATRDQKVGSMAQQWEQRYGRVDARDSSGRTFEQNLEAWAERNPLMGRR